MAERKAEIKRETLDMINEYISELNLNNFRIKTAVLFGSYAKGSYDEWSDIDLALVSDDFTGNRFNDKEKIRKFNAKFNYMISPMPYRTVDFKKENLFVDEILSTGIRIV